MKAKLIKSVLARKLSAWRYSITDPVVNGLVSANTLVTGGCFVSMLHNEAVNDYDIYFTNRETSLAVAKYYAGQYKKRDIHVVESKEDRVEFFIRSNGVEGILPAADENEDEEPQHDETGVDDYQPVFFSPNAVTLKGKIQIITRFYGDAAEIHKNFDFIHCTCSYEWATGRLNLPTDALLAIINKDLIYQHSLYPVCAIIRTRKFIKRGWKITAGQYVKMIWDAHLLNLQDWVVLQDQLVGVDSSYFRHAFDLLRERCSSEEIDGTYLFEVIDEIF